MALSIFFQFTSTGRAPQWYYPTLAQLLAERDAEAQARQDALSRESAAKTEVTRLQDRLQKMEAGQQEALFRQQALQEQLIKAEAQIDLIKDLLLRELEL